MRIFLLIVIFAAITQTIGCGEQKEDISLSSDNWGTCVTEKGLTLYKKCAKNAPQPFGTSSISIPCSGCPSEVNGELVGCVSNPSTTDSI